MVSQSKALAEEKDDSATDPKTGSYQQLQEWLVITTMVVSLAATLCIALVYTPALAANYALGAAAGVVYLRMLGRGVATLGKSRSRLGMTRFVLFIGLIVIATQVKSLQVLPIFFGFITYKVTLLIYLFKTLIPSSRK